MRAEIARYIDRFDGGSKAWSFGYHFCLFVSLALSTLAAFLAKSDGTGGTPVDATLAARRRTVVASCALLAGLLTAASAAGGFSGKWRANREARVSLTELEIDARDPDVPVSTLRRRLKEILREQSNAISSAEAH